MSHSWQGAFARILQASIALLAACTASAQGSARPAARGFSIESRAPGMDELVKPGTKLELLGDRYGLTEGPVWVDTDGGGYLLFADLISNVIYKWAPKEGTSVFLDKAGYSGDDIYSAGTQTLRGRMHVLLIGPNGITLDRERRVVWCASPDGKIMRLEKDGRRTVLAEKYQGKRFSGPNDLVYRSDGRLYFTETIWGLRNARGGHDGPARELPFTGIFMVNGADVALAIDEKTMGGQPNGLAFSPDEKYLYLNAGEKNIMRYEVKPDGGLANGKVFFPGEGSDGIKVDVKGNVYTTNGAGPGEVRITSPQGVRLGVLNLPVLDREPQAQVCATNVAFGDRDSKGLYITACEHVYRVQMQVAGVRPH